MAGVLGYADYPWSGQQQLMIDTDLVYDRFGDYAAFVLTHEFGHALGLSHPFEGEPDEPNYKSNLPGDLQGTAFSVMSYDDMFLDFDTGPGSETYTTFSPIDIRALQEIYTSGTNTANHRYIFSSDNQQVPVWEGDTLRSSLNAPFTLVDTGGLDWVDLSAYGPSFSSGQMTFSFTEGLVLPTKDNLWTTRRDPVTGTFTEWETQDSVRILTIQPGTVIEKVTGTQRDDKIVMTDGDQEAIGAGGFDTAAFYAATSAVTLTFSDQLTFTVTDRLGGGGTDILADIERLEFADRSIALDDYRGMLALSKDEFTELTEMYVAYFNRAADAAGLYFWADARGDGTSLQDIAEFFFDQDETRALYTNPNDTNAFVSAVYSNVLGRTPDQEGFDYWTEWSVGARSARGHLCWK